MVSEMAPLQSKKAGVLRAKMVFGALTILDLHEVVKSRGGYQERYSSYSIGSHWLPISFVRRSSSYLLIWTVSVPSNEADIRIPLDTVVKVVGNLVSLNLHVGNVENGYGIGSSSVDLRIQLDFVPFPENV